jgi:hypothetical protein
VVDVILDPRQPVADLVGGAGDRVALHGLVGDGGDERVEVLRVALPDRPQPVGQLPVTVGVEHAAVVRRRAVEGDLLLGLADGHLAVVGDAQDDALADGEVLAVTPGGGQRLVDPGQHVVGQVAVGGEGVPEDAVGVRGGRFVISGPTAAT